MAARELEAAKFLQKLFQESKNEPAKLATKINVIMQHMRSSGKENSIPYKVMPRALETLIIQHNLRDPSLNSESQFALSSGMDEVPIKIKQPKISLLEIEDDPLSLDHSHQLPVGEDTIHHKGLIVGAEKDSSSYYVINETCTEETSKRKKPEKGINKEILSEHFGKPLADAAERFSVSRSTFKRMCRDHGITRWKSSKRRLVSDSSSKHRTVNDDELRMNSSLMFVPPLHDTAFVALPRTSQDMNKINVKATYKGTAIRFELLDSSGMTELEDMVIERLKLKRHTFSIKYKDDEGDWILFVCDNDVQKCIEISRSLKSTVIRMLVDSPISG